MKIRCAWCRKLLGYKCPFCGGELKPLKQDDGTIVLVCDQPLARIVFSNTTNMRETHTICPECQITLARKDNNRLSQEDRANLAALDGKETVQ